MRKFFDYEGPVFVFLSRFADLCWINLLFVLCCIPVVTAGASLTAMYYVTLKMVKNEETYITKQFFKSFKENFLQATGIWLIILVVAGVLGADIYILANAKGQIFNSDMASNVVMVATFITCIILIFITLYVFPILAQFVNSVKNTIKNAFLLSIRHLPYTLLFIAITVVPWVVIGFFPQLFLAVLIIFSLQAYVKAKFFKKIFERYMPGYSEEGAEVSAEAAETAEGEAIVTETAEGTSIGTFADNNNSEDSWDNSDIIEHL